MNKILLIIHPELGELSIKEITDTLTLEDMQAAVGGYIEPCAPQELRDMGYEMLANEEGLLKGLPPNQNLYPFFFVGNLAFVKVVGEDFEPLTYEDGVKICEWVEGLHE